MDSVMNGYDKAEALAFILRRIRKGDHPELTDRIPDLVRQAIDADIAYMHAAGVLDAEGNAGGAWYEEDDAFEYIVEKLAADNDFSPEEAVKMAALVDNFFDAQAAYMEYAGLVQDEG